MLALIELFLVSRFFFGLYAPHAFNFHLARPKMDVVRDRPLENLWRGGGRSTKKIFAQGKITRKKFMHWRHLILKYIHAMPLKKIDTRNLITKKNSCGSKIPPPQNFSNGPSLIRPRKSGSQLLKKWIFLPLYQGFLKYWFILWKRYSKFDNLVPTALGTHDLRNARQIPCRWGKSGTLSTNMFIWNISKRCWPFRLWKYNTIVINWAGECF